MSDKEDAIRYRKLRDNADLSEQAYFVTTSHGERIAGGKYMDEFMDRWSPPMLKKICVREQHEWYWARGGEWCRWCGEPKPE